MKLKWKIPLLFFCLISVLFVLIGFYLRFEVVDRVWKRIDIQRAEHLAIEKEFTTQVAALYPDIKQMKTKMKDIAKTEKVNLYLYDKEGVEVEYSVKIPLKGRGNDVHWYPLRHQGETVAFIQVQRPLTEKGMGLPKAFTETFLFQLLPVSFLLLLVALYFNTSVTRPIARLNRRLDQVGHGRPLSPLASIKRRDEIGELYRRFGEMEERLNQAHQEQVDMVAAISHDLKTPLTSLNGFLELLATKPALTEGERQDYLRVARRKTENITQLLEDFSRFTQGEVTLQHVPLTLVPFSPFFESVAEEYEAELTGLGHSLIWHNFISKRTFVRIHEPMCRRVFANLIHNAVRYGNREELTVWMKAEFIGNQIFISVEDNGVGVPDKDLPHLFERFFTVDSSRGAGTSGSGLGLASCRSIIHRHGGDIKAYRNEGGGLGISFTLPIHRED
ncbi:HAMP domain-containing sensor histidine kinase [Marininema halotolerans]|uniref:histidine kinase n=1 Tax=Marininema halotolerans TaxID=1155944 RepID=A0A1I6UHF3_9BACL|nr:HAMP domain-containing sensor histidine kinase [Marininema halotolerans]SFT00851.1 Signal transduction histidine kinase [Marininema halotolerans]